jgi:hypothetical protein
MSSSCTSVMHVHVRLTFVCPSLYSLGIAFHLTRSSELSRSVSDRGTSAEPCPLAIAEVGTLSAITVLCCTVLHCTFTAGWQAVQQADQDGCCQDQGRQQARVKGGQHRLWYEPSTCVYSAGFYSAECVWPTGGGCGPPANPNTHVSLQLAALC